MVCVVSISITPLEQALYATISMTIYTIGNKIKPINTAKSNTETISKTKNTVAIPIVFQNPHFAIIHQQKNAPNGPKKNEMITASNPDEPFSGGNEWIISLTIDGVVK